MKATKFILFMLIAVATLSACKKKGGGDDIIIEPGILQGNISSNMTLTNDRIWILNGYVYVTAGATLTIEPGTVIRSDISNKGALIIERDARIQANGTATQPIVFTSGKAPGERTPGDWGGVIILGNATTNRGTNPRPTIEGGVGRTYGGTNDADNSGVFRYVRIEWAGIAAQPGSEINGLTTGGVGTGTVIEYVQTTFANDDAFEFFGGTHNARFLVAHATADDDFDFDFGYRGNIQFAVALRDPSFVDPGDAGNGIEADNDGSGTNASPNTRPVLSNFTMIGPGTNVGANTNHNHGNRWRRAVQFVLRNSIIAGWRVNGLNLESDATINAYLANTSEFRNNILHGHALVVNSGNQTLLSNDNFRTKVEAEGTSIVASVAAINLTSTSITAPNLLPQSGSIALSGASFTGLPSFFQTTSYRGAFGSSNWMAGWTNFTPQTTVY